MKRKLAEQIIELYQTGGYIAGNKDLWYDSYNERIVDRTDTTIAKYESYEDNRGVYKLFLVVNDLTLNDKKWEKYKVDLAQAANKYDIFVIFKYIDIGFGEEDVIRSKKELLEHMIKIAKCSQDKDIQTCVRISSPNYCVYSYNQKINDRMIHAEQVVEEYLDLSLDKYCRKHEHVYCLYEPCYDCLSILSRTAQSICILHPHKRKWETDEYRKLYFAIRSMKVKNDFGEFIYINFDRDKIVDRFYKGKVIL